MKPQSINSCAIYTRYSSDLQKPTSTEDQIRMCKKAARDAGWSIYKVYSDEEKSGTFMGNRPAFRQLIADARRKKFQVVVAEGLDRLSRDLGDIAYFYKAMKFDDIKVYSVTNRTFVTEMHVSFEGLKNQQYSQDLAEKVRRGQRGATARGKLMGSTAYGYRRLTGVGIEPGTVEINADQKKIIERIFNEYAGGKSALAIAKDLNRDHIPSAQGGRWSQAVICGRKISEMGILRNKLYAGVLSYGKAEYRRDPDTNIRKARVGTDPERRYVPELRIISDELFSRCQKRLEEMACVPLNERVRPKRLLTKKVYCGVCGAPYVGVTNGKLRCRGRTFDGTCSNRRGIDRVVLETTLLHLLKTTLLDSELIRRYIAEYRKVFRRAVANHDDKWHTTGKRERDLQKQTDRLLEKIRSGQAEGAAGQIIMQDFNRLSADLENVRLELANKPPPPPEPVATELVIERISQQLDALQNWIDDDSVDASYARDMFRCLVDRITLTPVGPDSDLTGSGPLAVEITGKIADLLILAGESPNCIIQSRQSRLYRLDNTNPNWRISGEIPGQEALLGGTHDVLAVLGEAEALLTAEIVTLRVLERRGEAATPERKAQIARRVRDCLKVHHHKGTVIEASGPKDYLNKWTLAERAAELAPLAPRPVLQMTEGMDFALKLLSKNKSGLKSSEIAKLHLKAKGIEPIKARWKAEWNRLSHSFLRFERAGVLKNISPPHTAAKLWVLAAPLDLTSSIKRKGIAAGKDRGLAARANPPRTPTADLVWRDPYRKAKSKKRKAAIKSKTRSRHPKYPPAKRPITKSITSKSYANRSGRPRHGER